MKKINKNLLICFPDSLSSFSANSRDFDDLMNTFNSLKFNIDVCFACYEKPDYKKLRAKYPYLNEIFFIKRSKNLINLFSFKPFQIISRKGLKYFKFRKKYHSLFLSGEYVTEILDNNHLNFDNSFIRINNNEFYYFFELFKSSRVLTKAYYLLESIKFFIHYKIFKYKFDYLLFASYHESVSSFFFNYSGRKFFFPPSVSYQSVFNNNKSMNILFVGNLFMPNNIYSLRWFINNVHPTLTEHFKDYNFIIAGSILKSNQSEFIKNLVGSFSNIKVFFNKKNISHLYKSSRLFVNPVFHGGGIKVKNIHSFQNGLPVLTTSKGIMGTNFINDKDILIANSANEFLSVISDVFNNRVRLDKVFYNACLKLKTYDQAHILKKYI